jgi:hypothetical protein
MNMLNRIKIAHRRLLRQKGQSEMMMFGMLVLFVYIPIFMGMFIIGMNLVFNIQANTVARDLDNMYIHGTDFSTSAAQALAVQIAGGLNLQAPTFGSGTTNLATNTGTSGNGIVWLTQIMYIGSTSGNQCSSVLPATCTNANSFVYTQQIIFGNSSLTTQKNTTMGSPTGATISAAGVVSNYVTDAHAALGSVPQAAMTALWQTASNGQANLTDGQVAYVVETFFQTPQLTLGIYKSNGVYARYFF